MKFQQIVVGMDGEITTIDTPELRQIAAALGTVRQERVSHIWPVNKTKRAAFRLLRRWFGETGRIAAWTRKWKGPWQVRWVSNPSRVVYSHKRRSQCLYWEKRELERRLVSVS